MERNEVNSRLRVCMFVRPSIRLVKTTEVSLDLVHVVVISKHPGVCGYVRGQNQGQQEDQLMLTYTRDVTCVPSKII